MWCFGLFYLFTQYVTCLANMLLQFSEGLLKTPTTSEHDISNDDADDSHIVFFDNISTPSTTVGTIAAKTGPRHSAVDFSLTNLRTELRNVFAGLKNKHLTKGLTFILQTFFVLCVLYTIEHICSIFICTSIGSFDTWLSYKIGIQPIKTCSAYQEKFFSEGTEEGNQGRAGKFRLAL